MNEVIQPVRTARVGIQRPAHKLSIIIPAYNEERTISIILEKIRQVNLIGRGRTYMEGKKIKWTHGVKTVFCILKYGISMQGKIATNSPRPATISATLGEPVQ